MSRLNICKGIGIICFVLMIGHAPSLRAASLISYTLNGTPATTDQLLLIDDPSGSWAVNRVTISVLWDLLRVAPGAIGGTTPAAGTFTSVTIAKSSGVAGTNLLYEANSTDTNGVGWQGPASRSSDLYLTFSNDNPTAGQIMTFGVPTGSGPYYSAISWASTSANGLSILGATYATTQGYLSVDDLITLSGVAEGAVNLGAFTGSTITDGQTVKQALQLLETAVEGVGGGHDAVTLAADAGAILGLSTQEINLDTQTANYVFAGPTSGGAADPTFRALVDADIPGTLTSKTIDADDNAFNDIPLQKDFGITDPADADDMMIFKAQKAMTITDIHCFIGGGTSITLDVQECAADGTSCSTVDAAITCDADGAEDDGTFTNGAIDAGDWVKMVLGAPSGTVPDLTFSIYYKESW